MSRFAIETSDSVAIEDEAGRAKLSNMMFPLNGRPAWR